MKKLLFAIVLTSITMMGICHAETADKYIGEIFTFAGSNCPDNSLETNGKKLLATDYEKLFSIILVTYGGDGADYFALPKIPPITLGDGTQGTNIVALKTCIVFEGVYPSFTQPKK